MQRFVMLVAVLGLTACLGIGTPPDASNDPSDPATETFAPNLHINIAQMTKTALGDYYQDLRVGTGLTLGSPQLVVFSYETFLKTGVLVDQQVGVTQDLNLVVRGLSDGMIGMQEGGERVIVVPSALAFGPVGRSPIPPNATIVYDVALEAVP